MRTSPRNLVHRGRTLAGALVALVGLAACGEARTPAEPPPPVVYAYELANQPETRLELAIDRSLEHTLRRDGSRARVHGGDAARSRACFPAFLVEGRRLEIEDDVLLLDGVSLGPVRTPTRISVDPKGVSVDGELRAPF